MQIEPSIIEEIRTKADIGEVIKKYLPLKKRGNNYITCCPFHKEKTPSFTINQTKQMYYCFGCGANGDVLKFIMDHTGSNFEETIKQLAIMYDIAWEKVTFKSKSYIKTSDLGNGACGRTVLLYDSEINEYFACKKYQPYDDTYKQEFYSRFVQEIKILHLISHQNIVRVFNHILYPEKYLGYILMEYIQGTTIEEYLKSNLDHLDRVFEQTIFGFSYLEQHKILHRDIRANNIMVNSDGIVKIIDFGFGIKVYEDQDFEKSITLNWHCSKPSEFVDKKYDFVTEVYFVGQLFKYLLDCYQIKKFQYNECITAMCNIEYSKRIDSFIKIERKILSGKFTDNEFSIAEINIYRKFSSTIKQSIIKICKDAEYLEEQTILSKLEELYSKSMLEQYLPCGNNLIYCFINGEYSYNHKTDVETTVIKDFIDMMKLMPDKKQQIIYSNLYNVLDSVPRYSNNNDIPF
jgi:serine/threonine protein kinase